MPVKSIRFMRLLLGAINIITASLAQAEHSVARQWNEELLEAIRNDFARPTTHARNLFHTSAAMWDAWAAYDPVANQWLHQEKLAADDPQAARREAVSYAAYRLLSWRFRNSPGADATLAAIEARMADLGFDPALTDTAGDAPAALGNRIAAAYIDFGLDDGANEAGDYENRYYEPVNPPLIMALPGNPEILDPNRYQQLSLRFFLDQAGNPLPLGFPEFLSPEWGQVVPFALHPRDLSVHRRDGFDYWTYHDPGPPPHLGGAGDVDYKAGFAQVLEWSGLLDPADGVLIDISPAARGRNTLGTNDGHGYSWNPRTGLPYAKQRVRAGDYYRVLAEFWADGPDSETPPGHWFTIANYVSDHPLSEKRYRGEGARLDDLEWDVKLYFALGGAMHDTAVSAWGVKGRYDYVRPVSAIRYMAGRGQSSDPAGMSYDPEGLPLIPGRIELVTAASTQPGARHEFLAGPGGANIGKVAVYAWRGPDYIGDPGTTTAGVGWILAEEWWPYQRPSFVTPPFAGYVSGHSTYSRAAAELLTQFTGDAFFPGGLGEFHAPRNEFLVFEDGPSQDITLQWARYYDAADECSLSRIYGGIHPTADDIPGRLMGAEIGADAFGHAELYFQGHAARSTGLAPLLPTSSPLGMGVFSGSWYDPAHNGEGWVVQALDEDKALVYWFTYDEVGNQAWLYGTGRRVGRTLAATMYKTSGPVFGPDFDANQVVTEEWGRLALVLRNCGRARVDWQANDATIGQGFLSAGRLTRLAGLNCQAAGEVPPPDGAEYSGSWYDPVRDGDGFVVEVIREKKVLIYWFTYDNNGNQVWLFGTGQREGNRIEANLQRSSGPVFGAGFDPASLSFEDWGSVSLEFDGCNAATVSYDSVLPAFGSGELETVRLTGLHGLDCPGLDKG